MAKITGQRFRIYIVDNSSQTVFPLESTSTLSIENAVIDASDKDSGGFADQIDGRRSWTVDGTFNYDQTNSEIQDIIDSMLDTTTSTELTVLVGQNTDTGDIALQGTALIASISFSAGNDELVTADFSLTGNSPLTKVTKS